MLKVMACEEWVNPENIHTFPKDLITSELIYNTGGRLLLFPLIFRLHGIFQSLLPIFFWRSFSSNRRYICLIILGLFIKLSVGRHHFITHVLFLRRGQISCKNLASEKPDQSIERKLLSSCTQRVTENDCKLIFINSELSDCWMLLAYLV